MPLTPMAATAVYVTRPSWLADAAQRRMPQCLRYRRWRASCCTHSGPCHETPQEKRAHTTAATAATRQHSRGVRAHLSDLLFDFLRDRHVQRDLRREAIACARGVRRSARGAEVSAESKQRSKCARAACKRGLRHGDGTRQLDRDYHAMHDNLRALYV